MTKALIDHSNNDPSNPAVYCFICWAWKNRKIRKTPDHKYFLSCKDKSDYFIHWAMGWIDGCKKKLRIGKYGYCHQCGLPQKLSTHPIFKVGVKTYCPYDDLVALVLWTLIHDAKIWPEIVKVFPSLRDLTGTTKKVEGLCKVPGPGQLYIGLDVLVWFWVRYRKGHN